MEASEEEAPEDKAPEYVLLIHLVLDLIGWVIIIYQLFCIFKSEACRFR